MSLQETAETVAQLMKQVDKRIRIECEAVWLLQPAAEAMLVRIENILEEERLSRRAREALEWVADRLRHALQRNRFTVVA